MQLRIDITLEGPRTLVKVAGHLSGGASDRLTEACERIEGAFTLDLTELLSADDPGSRTLLQLQERGAELRGASPFVQLLLNSASLWDPSDAL